MASSKTPKILFEVPFDDRTAYEAQARGYMSHVAIQDVDGAIYPVIFYDAVRLAQDLESEAAEGRPFIADAGMIVILEVTLDNMVIAARQLCVEGYFSSFIPVDETSRAFVESHSLGE